MKIIIFALLVFFIQEHVDGKPLLDALRGKILHTVQKIGCSMANDNHCRYFGREVTGVELPSEGQSSTVTATTVRIETDGGIMVSGSGKVEDVTDAKTVAATENGDEAAVSPLPKVTEEPRHVIKVSQNCATGFRMDRQNKCRRIE